jgi:hypothetical protein
VRGEVSESLLCFLFGLQRLKDAKVYRILDLIETRISATVDLLGFRTEFEFGSRIDPCKVNLSAKVENRCSAGDAVASISVELPNGDEVEFDFPFG